MDQLAPGDPADISKRILAAVSERLVRNPRDADALFAKAAALATAGDLSGALEVLSALAAIDEVYPGWFCLIPDENRVALGRGATIASPLQSRRDEG